VLPERNSSENLITNLGRPLLARWQPGSKPVEGGEDRVGAFLKISRWPCGRSDQFHREALISELGETLFGALMMLALISRHKRPRSALTTTRVMWRGVAHCSSTACVVADILESDSRGLEIFQHAWPSDRRTRPEAQPPVPGPAMTLAAAQTPLGLGDLAACLDRN